MAGKRRDPRDPGEKNGGLGAGAKTGAYRPVLTAPRSRDGRTGRVFPQK
jgi:hypothetical protein